jgi:hypothetical protein
MSADAIKKLNDIREGRSMGNLVKTTDKKKTDRATTEDIQKMGAFNPYKDVPRFERNPYSKSIQHAKSMWAAEKEGENYKPRKLGGKTRRRKGKKSRKTQKRR